MIARSLSFGVVLAAGLAAGALAADLLLHVGDRLEAGMTTADIDDIVVDDHDGPQWLPDGQTVLFVKRDFKRDNPVMWARADGSASGRLETGTQLNGDLALYGDGGPMKLAFKALGQTGSSNKTWERLYVVTFTAADLKAE